MSAAARCLSVPLVIRRRAVQAPLNVLLLWPLAGAAGALDAESYRARMDVASYDRQLLIVRNIFQPAPR
jgi:hypothetical protein